MFRVVVTARDTNKTQDLVHITEVNKHWLALCQT
jgi:hypothetical protein